MCVCVKMYNVCTILYTYVHNFVYMHMLNVYACTYVCMSVNVFRINVHIYVCMCICMCVFV